MLDILYEVENQLPQLYEEALVNKTLKSMFIDYHEPYVKRLWFPYKEQYRIYLHKIYKSLSSTHSLFHFHPWKSAMRIIKGQYEMGIGSSPTVEEPPVVCKLILIPGMCYEMIHPEGWHYVNPISEFSYSLMVTGDLFKTGLKLPIQPDKSFRELDSEEKLDIRQTIVNRYF